MATGILTYISESYNELKNHVTWPTFAEGQRLTIIVLVFSIIFSLAIWGIDSAFSSIMDFYLNFVS